LKRLKALDITQDMEEELSHPIISEECASPLDTVALCVDSTMGHLGDAARSSLGDANVISNTNIDSFS